MQSSRTVIGLDIAKRVFQLHWVDVETNELMNLRLTRAKLLEHIGNRAPFLVGMEACGGSQHWARRLQLLGHEVSSVASEDGPTVRERQQERSARRAGDLEIANMTDGRMHWAQPLVADGSQKRSISGAIVDESTTAPRKLNCKLVVVTHQ